MSRMDELLRRYDGRGADFTETIVYGVGGSNGARGRTSAVLDIGDDIGYNYSAAAPAEAVAAVTNELSSSSAVRIGTLTKLF